ncbi:serine-protein kinase ATM [Geosmithia morbida]|uniref:Serine/threonine-protein kinase Tel1 n=1 Tax=Geosmithia morbida TaxID=1094350 RepID=A0A9P5D4V2_9HYPO|nr:serine-protein kinase ATM [Geosmithia morbida]KAF4123140.1 serine-protein kinase ATM [Geosmithia morbida]
MSSHKSTVMSLARDVKSASLKDREKAIDGDKGYHEIFEAIFSFVLREKPSLYDKRKSQATSSAASSRLSKCAAAVRMAVGRGTSKLGPKTLQAVIDHITQVLPGPNDDFVMPLLQDYVKALAELLSHSAHVELLARKDGAPWKACVDFFLELMAHVLPEEGDFSAFSSRASPVPEPLVLRSTAKADSSTPIQRRAGQGEGGPLRDSLEGLRYLVQGANAPILQRSREVVDTALRALKVKHLSLGAVQTLCFAILNTVFSSLQGEEREQASSLVKGVVPLMAYWWKADKVSQDELIRALRNEISKCIFLTHLYLEFLTLGHNDGWTFASVLEDLADQLWQEYSKRSEAVRLQLIDVTFSLSSLPGNHMRNSLFGLRPHNIEGEGYWALVQNLAILESILLRSSRRADGRSGGNDEQPRKKRRTQEEFSRLRTKLKSKHTGTRRTALQMVPFLLDTNALGENETAELLGELVVLGSDKDAINSSWALIAYFQTPARAHATISSGRRYSNGFAGIELILLTSPGELSFASFHSIHVHPFDFVNLLRACCGMAPLPPGGPVAVTGGSLRETWRLHEDIGPFVRYLLLLSPIGEPLPGHLDPHLVSSPPLTDPNSFHASKKLILELFSPKLRELDELCLSWSKKTYEGGTQISVERFQGLLSAVIIGAMLIPQISGLDYTPSSTVESDLLVLAEKSLRLASTSVEPPAFVDCTLRLVRPCIPMFSAASLDKLDKEAPALLNLLVRIHSTMDQMESYQASGNSCDIMDIDQDFDSQVSRASATSGPVTAIPRKITRLEVDSRSFYMDTKVRMEFLRVIKDAEGQIGLLPSQFIDELIAMSNEDLLLCQRVLVDIFKSDLAASHDSVVKVIKRLGAVMSESDYRCCEIALTLCIDVMEGSSKVWLDDTQDLAADVGDLYVHFVRRCLPSNILSAKAHISLVNLLLTLLRVDHEYGNDMGVESCRTSLLYILEMAPMEVKYFIGRKIACVFELYVLKLHDDVFVDVLASLPKDQDNAAGIAFRLLVLSKLACRWPTLLRRCTYHIFETPGKIECSADHATRCLADVSEALDLDTPKELFGLFSRQLLYTWLEEDSIDTLPYSVFGFDSLADLLRSFQAEALGLIIMRGQDETSASMAKCIGVRESDLLNKNFATSMAYSMMYGDAFEGGNERRGEKYIERKLSSQIFMEAKYTNFVDIVAIFFDLIDQDNPIEKTFRRQDDLMYAAEIMQRMKGISHSDSELPPNQQPMFKARYLIVEIRRLCENMLFDFDDLWTPALVSLIARKLLNTVHPALGSLHACSVLRKIRILICLAGPIAINSHCLELLLNSTRSFLVDPECADDALGVSHYLLYEGVEYLSQTPSFVAGYALSTLASLRVFLESSQSSTTQKEQFKATMSKAKQFHSWFTEYLASYDSASFTSTSQRDLFKSITESAAHVQSSGNATKGTAESKLLLYILMDGASHDQLLNESARDVALGILCNDFTIPSRALDDVVDNDGAAVQFAAEIWKSCRVHNLSESYLSWAGRVMGRSFAASGKIPEGILRETQLSQYRNIASGSNASERGLLNLLQQLTSSPDSITAGLAETALRKALSQAVSQNDEPLLMAAQKTLREPLYLASQWDKYHLPPSENDGTLPSSSDGAIWTEEVSSPSWLSQLCIHLTRSVSDSIILSALPPIFSRVEGFAQKAFPFLVHLVLCFQLDKQQSVKRLLSGAMRNWLGSNELETKDGMKQLLNMVLYLRTQEYPKESSIADRTHWLDIDYSQAASAACRCGMYKTSLLFAELASSESTRSSRRSSAIREESVNDTLLAVFENIDDPDAYYGLPEDASLSKVLSRVEYENEGMKSLAFRGAQYDSHLRQRNPSSGRDAQCLVKTLNTLGLSGLSNSLLQTQQNIGSTPSSLESTFHTAQALEMWNLPAPVASDHHAVVTYKAFQSMYQATSASLVQSTIYDGFKRTMHGLTNQDLNATAIRKHLGALATLADLDDLMNVRGPSEIEEILDKFKSRSEWMKRGLYDDVSQILSSRGTAMSMLSQNSHLIQNATVSVAKFRVSQMQSMLLSAGIYRYYRAAQESINVATTLMGLIPTCEEHGLVVDAAVKVEAANSLWDYGEMSTSIRILQGIDRSSSLVKQSIPITRPDLLSKIGHQVSVARLEKPQDIQKKYLEPALKELRGRSEGREAGLVYHQFAMFCDGQLQDPASMEDLARLQSLRKGKSTEVEQLKSLIDSAKNSQQRIRYNHVLAKEKQWLSLDEQELRRVEQTRSEFVRLSLENYLLALIASDDHNKDALRFIALWLERSAEDSTNKAVVKYLRSVPTRKFATLMNQLTSRLQDLDNTFQKLLMELVYNICVDHPYHGMYQIWSGTKAKAQSEDEVALQRIRATEKVRQRLTATKSVANAWLSVDKTSKYYHALAMEKNASKYKSGIKVNLKDSVAANNLVSCLMRYPIPPPTMDIEISVTKEYSNVPMVAKLEPQMTIASGVSAPKIITAVGTDGVRYKQLVKGGHDDLRQDAIMEQVFAAVSALLKLHRETQQRSLGIRTYKVLPLTATSGLIEFVPNTIPLHEFLMPAHERYYPTDLKGSQCRKEIFRVQNNSTDTRISTYRKVTDKFHPVMRYFFMENFADPDEWFYKRLAYTRTTAAISMLGHVLGLGDRHGHNILLDAKTGEVVHIDLGVAFEAGRILPVPELVPFRLTRDIVDGMGMTKTEGVFRRCCEFTLDAMREEQYSIMTILDVLRYDPLYTWSISPLRLAKLQKARENDDAVLDEADQNEAEAKKGGSKGRKGGDVNEPSEADRALEVVRKKLSKTLSVTATVNDLINQAMDECNLAMLYSGWAAYA